LQHQLEGLHKGKEDMIKTIMILRKENSNLMSQIKEERNMKATTPTTTLLNSQDEVHQLTNQLKELQITLKELLASRDAINKENEKLKKQLNNDKAFIEKQRQELLQKASITSKQSDQYQKPVSKSTMRQDDIRMVTIRR
jgi:uncharacterized protein (DUF885 family)